MRKLLFLSAAILLITGCCGCQTSDKPLSGSDWGEVRNGSIEEVISNDVPYWSAGNQRFSNALCFYDSEAHDGTKSLCISADGFAVGQWTNKVNLRPWSRYRFTGWIKTENVVGEKENSGAGFVLTNIGADEGFFVGDNDWRKVAYEFETGDNDCTNLICMLGGEDRGARAKGKAWFDEMSFELLSSEKINTKIVVDPSKQGAPMSEYIYGQFIEHLGKCIYGGIWSEMVMDRKFWYAPGVRESPWKVLGKGDPKGLFQMDTKSPFVGEHTPVLISDGNDVVLEQRALGINAGVAVEGYVFLKSNRPMKVAVELSAGGVTRSVEIATTSSYAKYPLSFKAFDAKEKDAVVRIIPKGNGKLWVGTASLMPVDNVSGFRADVLELLKGLNSPVYRWPGGNFVSGYDWKDGIGNRDSRPPRKNPAWSGVESNDVGIHEFMTFCELLGTEPYIAVNAGLGGVKGAAEEVEYCNGAVSTPMGALRAKNGCSEPWKVKWWSVGNEMFGDWQLGFMSTEAFVQKHNSFADAMEKVDPSITLIAVGNVGPWDEMIMANCADHMDLVSEHFYCQDYNGTGLLTHASQISRSIKHISDAHRGYRETIPALKGKDIKICMDEWNFWYGPHIYGELGTRYFLRDALGIAAGLNEYLRNSDIVFMANYAQTVNVIGCIKATTTDACYASTGEVLKTYNEHFGTVPVTLSGELRPFDVAAAIDPVANTLTVSIVNPTYEARKSNLSFLGETFQYDGKTYSLSFDDAEIYTITGPDDMAYNTPGYAPAVTTVKSAVGDYRKLTIKPYSANIIVFSYN